MSQEDNNKSNNNDGRLESKDVDTDLLRPEDESLLQKIENDPRLMLVIQRRFHNGPLPPPEDIAEYDRIIPNGADRIMAMVEKEQEGRISQTAKNSDSFFKMKARGQWFGFSVVILFTVLAAYLFSKEQYGLGASLLGANLVAVVAVFLADRYFQSKDDD